MFLLPVEIPVLYDLSIRGHCLNSFSNFFRGKMLMLLVAIQPREMVVDSSLVFAILLRLLNLR